MIVRPSTAIPNTGGEVRSGQKSEVAREKGGEDTGPFVTDRESGGLGCIYVASKDNNGATSSGHRSWKSTHLLSHDMTTSHGSDNLPPTTTMMEILIARDDGFQYADRNYWALRNDPSADYVWSLRLWNQYQGTWSLLPRTPRISFATNCQADTIRRRIQASR